MSLLSFRRKSAAAPPSAEEVRAQLTAILSSRRFRNSGTHAAFLRYIVEAALGGRKEALQEREIARVIFGRDETFDPRKDLVVAKVALKVRRNLERFYSRRANSNAFISLPRNSFVPVFTGRAESGGVRRRVILGILATLALVVVIAGSVWLSAGLWRWWVAKHGPWRKYRSVAVLPLHNGTGVRRLDAFMPLLTSELTSRLSTYSGLSVTPARDVKALDQNFFGREKPDVIARRLSAETLLRGRAEVWDRRLRLTLELIDPADGRRIWADAYMAPEPQLMTMAGDIAYSVATAMGATGK